MKWILLSFLIVAFGTPAWVPALGLVAAVCGYAFFWKGTQKFWWAVGWFTAVQLVQLSWMTADEYQGLYIWFVWALLALLMGLQFGLVTLLVKRKNILLVPAAWVLMEWSRLFFLSGFTWNPVGLSLTGFLVPRQLVAEVGIYGLSFLVMLTNVLVLRKPKLAIATAAIPYVFGVAHLFIHTQLSKSEESLKVLLVQPGILPGQREPVGVRPSQPMHPLDQWHQMLAAVEPHKDKVVDLIVLPECAVPFEVMRTIYPAEYGNAVVRHALQIDSEAAPTSNGAFCRVLADHFDADVVGGFDRQEEDRMYNAALHFQPGNSLVNRYGKRVLLPFAETLPGEWARALAKRYGVAGSYTKGEGACLFDGKIPLGITVCYEETFGYLVRQNKPLGAEMLVNITNDGWYPNSRLPQQHFYHGRLRALENGMPLVRACNSSITAAVDSLGRTVAQITDPLAAEALYVEVPRYHYATLYGLVGDGPAVGFSLLILLGSFALRKNKNIY